MKKENFLYILLFFLLVSPSLFNYELWPLSRYQLYSRLYPNSEPRFLGLYAKLADGNEVFLNSGEYLYPFFLFHLNLNLIHKHPNNDIPADAFTSSAVEKKLQTILAVLNHNRDKQGLPKAVGLTLYQVQWDQKMLFENFKEAKKQILIKEVKLD